MQNAQGPEGPNNRLPEDLCPQVERLSPETVSQIKSAQTLVTVCTISAPVSLLFGGVLLSTIALVCGWIAFRRLRAIKTRNAAEKTAVDQVAKSCKMGLIMAGIAFGLNAVSMAMMYPMYLEALETGDLSALTGATGEGAGSSANTGSGSAVSDGGSSVWG